MHKKYKFYAVFDNIHRYEKLINFYFSIPNTHMKKKIKSKFNTEYKVVGVFIICFYTANS